MVAELLSLPDPFPQNAAILLDMAITNYLLLIHKRNGRRMVSAKYAQDRFVHRSRFRLDLVRSGFV
jgi:hypothetical protein